MQVTSMEIRLSWIREIDETDADPALADVYEHIRGQRGRVANILRVHSLDPGALQAHLDLYMHLMFSRSGLSRLEREAVAVAVSAENACAYCVAHHLEALHRYVPNPDVLDAVREGHHHHLPMRLAAMLDHARVLTRHPSGCKESHIVALHAAGLDDAEILRVTLVVAYFNFVNRIALGLGVAAGADEVQGYRADSGD